MRSLLTTSKINSLRNTRRQIIFTTTFLLLVILPKITRPRNLRFNLKEFQSTIIKIIFINQHEWQNISNWNRSVFYYLFCIRKLATSRFTSLNRINLHKPYNRNGLKRIIKIIFAEVLNTKNRKNQHIKQTWSLIIQRIINDEF